MSKYIGLNETTISKFINDRCQNGYAIITCDDYKTNKMFERIAYIGYKYSRLSKANKNSDDYIIIYNINDRFKNDSVNQQRYTFGEFICVVCNNSKQNIEKMSMYGDVSDVLDEYDINIPTTIFGRHSRELRGEEIPDYVAY